MYFLFTTPSTQLTLMNCMYLPPVLVTSNLPPGNRFNSLDTELSIRSVFLLFCLGPATIIIDPLLYLSRGLTIKRAKSIWNICLKRPILWFFCCKGRLIWFSTERATHSSALKSCFPTVLLLKQRFWNRFNRRPVLTWSIKHAIDRFHFCWTKKFRFVSTETVRKSSDSSGLRRVSFLLKYEIRFDSTETKPRPLKA